MHKPIQGTKLQKDGGDGSTIVQANRFAKRGVSDAQGHQPPPGRGQRVGRVKDTDRPREQATRPAEPQQRRSVPRDAQCSHSKRKAGRSPPAGSNRQLHWRPQPRVASNGSARFGRNHHQRPTASRSGAWWACVGPRGVPRHGNDRNRRPQSNPRQVTTTLTERGNSRVPSKTAVEPNSGRCVVRALRRAGNADSSRSRHPQTPKADRRIAQEDRSGGCPVRQRAASGRRAGQGQRPQTPHVPAGQAEAKRELQHPLLKVRRRPDRSQAASEPQK